MNDHNEQHSSKHKRSHEKDPDRKSKKRHKHDDEASSSRKHKRKDKERSKLKITNDDPNDDDMWVEKNIDMDGERVSFLFYNLENVSVLNLYYHDLPA